MQALPFAALGAAGFSAASSFGAAKQAERAGERNLLIAQQEAKSIRESAELEEFQARKNLEAQVGRQITQFAGSGVDVTTGSPIDVITDTLTKGNLDIAINNYNAEVRARSAISQGQLDKFEAKQKATEQRVKAGLTLLQGVGTFAQQQGLGFGSGEQKAEEKSGTGFE